MFLGFLHQTGELRKHSHAREQERPGVGACAPIPVLFVTRGVINKFSQLSPGSLRCAGRNQQIQSIKPRQFTLRGGVINKFSQLSPGSLRCAGRNQQI